jgi:hypothetical protein
LEFGYWDLGFLVYDGGIELLQSCWVTINLEASLDTTVIALAIEIGL